MLAFATSRLLARPVEAEDAALFRDLYCDAATMFHIVPAFSPDEATGLLENAIAQLAAEMPAMIFMAIVEKSTRSPIGLCGIVQIDRAAGRAEAGILLKPACHRMGYASEAMIALVQCAFDALPVGEIRLEYRRRHHAMHRVADTCGFPPEEVDHGTEHVAHRCVRIAVRGAWRPSGSHAEQPGEHHVERHPLSRNDGSGCQPAACDR